MHTRKHSIPVKFQISYLIPAGKSWQVYIDRYGKGFLFISRTVISQLNYDDAIKISDANRSI